MSETRQPPFPEYIGSEPEDAYRRRLREWFDSIPDEPYETAGFRRGEWEYICSLAGVEPD